MAKKLTILKRAKSSPKFKWNGPKCWFLITSKLWVSSQGLRHSDLIFLFTWICFRQYGNETVQAIIASKISLYSSSRGSYSSSQSSSGGLQHSGIIGWSHSDEVVPPLSSAWLSDVVLPTIIVGIIVIISLFAVIVLIMLRRHLHLEGHGRHEYSIHHGPYLGSM